MSLIFWHREYGGEKEMVRSSPDLKFCTALVSYHWKEGKAEQNRVTSTITAGKRRKKYLGQPLPEI